MPTKTCKHEDNSLDKYKDIESGMDDLADWMEQLTIEETKEEVDTVHNTLAEAFENLSLSPSFSSKDINSMNLDETIEMIKDHNDTVAMKGILSFENLLTQYKDNPEFYEACIEKFLITIINTRLEFCVDNGLAYALIGIWFNFVVSTNNKNIWLIEPTIIEKVAKWTNSDEQKLSDTALNFLLVLSKKSEKICRKKLFIVNVTLWLWIIWKFTRMTQKDWKKSD